MTGTAGAVVVGGGVAGTTAALALADAGWDVTLLESRPRLGGAAYSFTRGAHPVDTGQHVLLRCYTVYLSLLERMGMSAAVPVERMDIPVLRPGAPPTHLRRARGLPAPVHLLPGLLGYRALRPSERLAAARVVGALRALDPDDPATDAQTFGDWLRRQGQGQPAIDRLWGLVAVAALNVDVDAASLALAARVFQTGLLSRAGAGDIAVPRVPLSRIHHDGALALLERVGVRTRTGTRVHAVTPTDRAFVVRTGDGEVEAERVVLAVPHDPAAGLVPPDAHPDRATWARLGASAIVNVHLRVDRRVTDLPYAAVVDSPVQWFFDRTGSAGGDGQYLVVSLSAADHLKDIPSRDLVARQRTALTEVLPGLAAAHVTDAFVTREPRATFHQGAGSRRWRPGQATALPGLVLAGAWTDTGWPDTLEGAARSGLLAARLLGAPAATSGATPGEATPGTTPGTTVRTRSGTTAGTIPGPTSVTESVGAP